MNIKKMQHVLALAEHLNFSRACADVHLSQPALSRSIQSIEAELGVNLFDRGGAKVALTPTERSLSSVPSGLFLRRTSWLEISL